jgi:hypothetical protein
LRSQQLACWHQIRALAAHASKNARPHDDSDGKQLATELDRLKPLNVLTLIRNDLRLPDDADAHRCHYQKTYSKNKPFLRFGSGTAKFH